MNVVKDQLENIAAHILRTSSTSGRNTYVFTSALPGEGKSFVIRELAQIIAQEHKPVLVVDLNYKNPQLTADLGIKEAVSKASLDRAELKVASTDNALIKALGVEKDGIGPASFADLNALDRFVEALSSQSEVVLIETPAFSESALGSLLASQRLSTIVVIKADATKKTSVDALMNALSHNHAEVAGTILNNKKRYLPKFLSRSFD